MFEPPNPKGYTIYSKSGCINCEKAKKEVERHCHPLTYINCDEYLIEDRLNFLLFMNLYAGKETTLFPMIFFEGSFIGGWKELTLHLEWN